MMRGITPRLTKTRWRGLTPTRSNGLTRRRHTRLTPRITQSLNLEARDQNKIIGRKERGLVDVRGGTKGARRHGIAGLSNSLPANPVSGGASCAAN